MARLTLRANILRALFARSGNQCAFPGCTHPLINEDNQLIGQICHIEAAMPGGERYNLNQTDGQRNGYDNLILMCYRHHIETNDIQKYPVERLRKIKYEHESIFEKSNFKIDEVALFKIMEEMETYWAKIERLNTLEHSVAELALNINAKGSFFNIVQECYDNVGYLQNFFDSFHKSDQELHRDFVSLLTMKRIDSNLFNDIPYYKDPFENRNWDLHNLGVPNRMQKLKIDLMHMEIKYLEEYLKTNSKDRQAKRRLESLKEKFANLAQHATVRD